MPEIGFSSLGINLVCSEHRCTESLRKILLTDPNNMVPEAVMLLISQGNSWFWSLLMLVVPRVCTILCIIYIYYIIIYIYIIIIYILYIYIIMYIHAYGVRHLSYLSFPEEPLCNSCTPPAAARQKNSSQRHCLDPCISALSNCEHCQGKGPGSIRKHCWSIKIQRYSENWLELLRIAWNLIMQMIQDWPCQDWFPDLDHVLLSQKAL